LQGRHENNLKKSIKVANITTIYFYNVFGPFTSSYSPNKWGFERGRSCGSLRRRRSFRESSVHSRCRLFTASKDVPRAYVIVAMEEFIVVATETKAAKGEGSKGSKPATAHYPFLQL
jgi:hypothetical protein